MQPEALPTATGEQEGNQGGGGRHGFPGHPTQGDPREKAPRTSLGVTQSVTTRHGLPLHGRYLESGPSITTVASCLVRMKSRPFSHGQDALVKTDNSKTRYLQFIVNNWAKNHFFLILGGNVFGGVAYRKSGRHYAPIRKFRTAYYWPINPKPEPDQNRDRNRVPSSIYVRN